MHKSVSLALLALAAASPAAVYTYGTLDQGWYRSDVHNTSNTNTLTGDYAGQEYRSFFAFNLSSIPSNEVIVGLTFRYQTFLVEGTDPILFQLSDVTTNYATLTAGTAPATTFADLGTGVQYGLQILTNADTYSGKSFSLNSAAIAAASAAGSVPFVLGGALVYMQPEEKIMGYSGASSVYFLDVTTAPCVPEPASMAVLGIGLAAFRRRRARRV